MTVDVAINLDHGKGHLHLLVNIIARWTKLSTEGVLTVKHENISVALGNARCKKDNAQIMLNTFGKFLNEDIQKVGRGIFIHKKIAGNSKSFSFVVDVQDALTIPFNIFLAADILLY